jgi:CRP-like cAMP-binding protein
VEAGIAASASLQAEPPASRIDPGASLSPDNGEVPARETFFTAFDRLVGDTLPRDASLPARIAVRTLARGAPLFAAGAIDRRVHVVSSGFLTLRYQSPEGASWVKGFVPAQVPFACLACLDGAPAPFDAHAGTDCVVASLPADELERIAGDSLPWMRALRNAYRVYGQRKEQREMELLMLAPEARYARFLQEMPGIAAQLRQHEIASYIRVTPVSLSRIRRRMRVQGR